jgi:malonate-semialdehyde dehydrogenase (acetylating) / methylmalonate-semialdehyde dehydrogenase
MEPGSPRPIDTADVETIELPLAGSCAVHHGETIQLSGRSDVFAGRTDFHHLPPGARTWLEAEQPARVALPFVAATGALSAATLADAVDLVDANPFGNGVALFSGRRWRGPRVPAHGPGRNDRHQRADPRPHGLLLLRRVEGVVVRRHACARPRRGSFYTQAKVVTARWPRPALRDEGQLHFPTAE